MTSVELYDNVYADFGSSAEAAVRRATYGEDIGQSSWMTATEWLGFADRLELGEATQVLEVGSGSGGPAVYLASKRRCRVTGVDINEHGVRNGQRLAFEHGVSDRVAFQAVDASRPLPFSAATFDAVVCNDAICHIPNRLDVLRDWLRVVRPSGRIVYTEATIVTGMISNEEIATRSSIGFYLFLPPGENERLIAEAGFRLLAADDVTEAAATVGQRWHDARESHRAELVAREGEANFEGLQRFLACTHRLAAERRLSRFAYFAEKPAGDQSPATSSTTSQRP
jgi:SAM-dependent methyltransferase